MRWHFAHWSLSPKKWPRPFSQSPVTVEVARLSVPDDPAAAGAQGTRNQASGAFAQFVAGSVRKAMRGAGPGREVLVDTPSMRRPVSCGDAVVSGGETFQMKSNSGSDAWISGDCQTN